MKIKFNRFYDRFYNGLRVSRKAKKYILGVIQTKNKIAKRIKLLKFEENGISYEHFCPSCGCSMTESTPNIVSYPDVYIIESCVRCKKKVGGADNSEWTHVLDKI